MRRIIFIFATLVANLILIPACGTQPEQPQQPEKIIETVVETITVEPTIEILLQANVEEVARFTRELLDITGECQASDFLYDFTSDALLSGYKAGIKNVREKCNLEEINIQMPENCEPCQNVLPIIQEHAKLMVEGTDQIDKGNATINQELLTEGLEKFWDADILWDKVADAIDSVRTAYNLPELTR